MSAKRAPVPEPQESDEVQHGVESVVWNNPGAGWYLRCLCGWESAAHKLLEDTGLEFDDHLREEGLLEERTAD